MCRLAPALTLLPDDECASDGGREDWDRKPPRVPSTRPQEW